MKITENIYYIGADDKTLDLFESQYIIPNGISYNSYVIDDEKIAVMDTVDKRKSDEWFEKLAAVLGEKQPSYLVVQHMEPDHSANVAAFMKKYPQAKLVLTDKALKMAGQFFDEDFGERAIVVAEGDKLELGAHTLNFIMAPMIHWPEVMMTYEESEKVFFSADAFGKFGALDADEDWACEARRYYFNIVGKYGVQVQALLKKAAALEIEKICPLHGPILTENLGFYIDKYDTWSSYRPEDEGVLIACASIHGNTMNAAKELADILREKGAPKVVLADLSRDDMAEVIEDAFRYSKIVLAAPTYDAGIFPCMESFLAHLKAKGYRNRKAAIVENGTWAPMAGKIMRAALESMKDITICDTVVSIRSALNDETRKQLNTLAEELV